MRRNCRGRAPIASLVSAAVLTPLLAGAQPAQPAQPAQAPNAAGARPGVVLPGTTAGGHAAKSRSVLGAVAIDIRSARYGRATGTLNCDATEAVREACEGKLRCRVRIEDSLCRPPQTPPQLLIPQLFVTYRCSTGDVAHFVRDDKPFSLVITCAGPQPALIPGSDN